MAGILASILLPSLLGIGGLPRAPTGRAQARAGVSRKKVLMDAMFAGGTGTVKPRRKATAGKKASAKQLAALAKGRATVKRNRNRRK
jgi:hypothetical protein